MSSNDSHPEGTRKEVLMQRYEFYTQEARHQRMMMWETAKWFAAIVVGLLIAAAQLYHNLDTLQSKNFTAATPALSFLILVLCVSLICIWLIKSFYRTNLIYISMFAKIEDDFGFDERDKKKLRHAFRDDEFITWHVYRTDRQTTKTSKDFIDKSVTVIGKGIYAGLSWVFITFCVFSLLAMTYIVKILQ